MKKLMALALLASLPSLALAAKDEGSEKRTDRGHTTDTLDQVKANIKSGAAVLVDVREKREWDSGHLDGAVLLPLSKIRDDPGAAAKLLPKNKIVYFHCAAGGRVLMADRLLRPRSIKTRPLKQGYGELIESGFKKAN